MPMFGIDGDQGPRGAGWVDPDKVRQQIATARQAAAATAKKEPGVVSRHLHFLVAVALIAICGFVSQDVVLMLIAVGTEWVLQGRHADNWHHADWRASPWVYQVGIAIVVGGIIGGIVGLPHSHHWYPLPIFLFGLIMASCTVHRIAHKWRHPDTDTDHRRDYVAKVVIGLATMGLATLYATP